MRILSDRFKWFRTQDDRVKESFLAEVAVGVADKDALAQVSTQYQLNPALTATTLRAWVRDDEDFAEALKGAHAGEGFTRVLAGDDVEGDAAENVAEGNGTASDADVLLSQAEVTAPICPVHRLNAALCGCEGESQ